MIEDAYQLGESMGLSVWCTDQAGPYQTIPYPGQSWRPEGDPARQPHEYLREGTAKALTLFRPADGHVRVGDDRRPGLAAAQGLARRAPGARALLARISHQGNGIGLPSVS